MWIKICGNTSLEDAQLAVDAGADALGFVFAESPRQVRRQRATTIAHHLPKNIEIYGVFVDAAFDEIVATVTECGLTGVQLHTLPDAALPLRLREHFAGQIRILRVLHYNPDLKEQLRAMEDDPAADAVLIDSRTATAVGGTGVAYDWSAVSSSFLRYSPRLRLISAGGLTPEIIAEAIDILQPWGVDVSSGVEASPGLKDPAKIKAFIQAARTAVSQFTVVSP